MVYPGDILCVLEQSKYSVEQSVLKMSTSLVGLHCFQVLFPFLIFCLDGLSIIENEGTEDCNYYYCTIFLFSFVSLLHIFWVSVVIVYNCYISLLD